MFNWALLANKRQCFFKETLSTFLRQKGVQLMDTSVRSKWRKTHARPLPFERQTSRTRTFWRAKDKIVQTLRTCFFVLNLWFFFFNLKWFSHSRGLGRCCFKWIILWKQFSDLRCSRRYLTHLLCFCWLLSEAAGRFLSHCSGLWLGRQWLAPLQ